MPKLHLESIGIRILGDMGILFMEIMFTRIKKSRVVNMPRPATAVCLYKNQIIIWERQAFFLNLNLPIVLIIRKGI